MSLSDFTKHKKKAFTASLVCAAFCDEFECFVDLDGVFEGVVITKIESISSRRHLLEESIRVETSLMMTDKAIAEEGAGNLTATSINRELSMACPQLPTATVLEAAKVVAVTQWPSPTEVSQEECSFTDTMNAQIPILFLCGLAYLGVKSKCSFAPKKTETQERLPTTGVGAPSQTPVTNSSNATVALVFPTTQEMLQMGQQRPPTGLPQGWQACIDQAGNIYYQNCTTKRTQWEHPAPLFPWGELRTVTLNRNPSKDGAQQTGIGISFSGSKVGQEVSGPSKILGVAPAGTAFQSGLIHAGDLLFKVNGATVLDLTAAQITDLILGEPSSPITLTISTPPALHASQPQLPQTPGRHCLAPTHGVGADPQARASGDVPDPPPATLVLSGQIKHQGWCLGAYTLVPGRSAHGRPVWRHERGDRYIAQLACGNWAVQKEDKVGFNEGALLYLADANVMFPHQSRVAWQEVDDKGMWFDVAGLQCDASARWTNTWENRSVTLTRGSTPPVPHASQPQLPQTPGKHSLALSPALHSRNIGLCVLRMQMHFVYSYAYTHTQAFLHAYNI
jgi:hypothetical protein